MGRGPAQGAFLHSHGMMPPRGAGVSMGIPPQFHSHTQMPYPAFRGGRGMAAFAPRGLMGGGGAPRPPPPAGSLTYVNPASIPCKWGAECYHLACEYKHPERMRADLAMPKSSKFAAGGKEANKGGGGEGGGEGAEAADEK